MLTLNAHIQDHGTITRRVWNRVVADAYRDPEPPMHPGDLPPAPGLYVAKAVLDRAKGLTIADWNECHARGEQFEAEYQAEQAARTNAATKIPPPSEGTAARIGDRL